MFITVMLLIVLPAMAVSITVALLPIKRQAVLLTVLAALMVVSITLIASAAEERRMWMIALGPGIALATVRIAGTLWRLAGGRGDK